MKRRIRDRLKMYDVKKYKLRAWRLKVKHHSSRSKKSFYKTCFWELWNRNNKMKSRFYKRLLRKEKSFQAKCDRENKKVAYVSWSIWSFHSGDNGCAYSIFDKDNHRICQQSFKTYEEAEVMAHVLGYDIVVQSHNNCIIIE